MFHQNSNLMHIISMHARARVIYFFNIFISLTLNNINSSSLSQTPNLFKKFSFYNSECFCPSVRFYLPCFLCLSLFLSSSSWSFSLAVWKRVLKEYRFLFSRYIWIDFEKSLFEFLKSRKQQEITFSSHKRNENISRIV